MQKVRKGEVYLLVNFFFHDFHFFFPIFFLMAKIFPMARRRMDEEGSFQFHNVYFGPFVPRCSADWSKQQTQETVLQVRKQYVFTFFTLLLLANTIGERIVRLEISNRKRKTEKNRKKKPHKNCCRCS